MIKKSALVFFSRTVCIWA